MSYENEVLKDNSRRDMLLILKPRKRIRYSEWALHSGSVYKFAWPWEKPTAFYETGTLKTEGTSTSLSAGEWYFDNEYLYYRMVDSAAPAAADWLVVQFPIYIGTREVFFSKTPTDSSGDEVVWRGYVKETPEIAQSSEDLLFGFSPVNTTSVTLHYDAEYFQQMLKSLTFSEGEIEIYHIAGPLLAANVTKLFVGIGGNYTLNDRELRLDIYDRSYNFNREANNSPSPSYWTAATQTDDGQVDPEYSNRPIRSLYGPLYGARGVCLDYVNDSPGTSDNRQWSFMTEEFGPGSIITEAAAQVDATATFIDAVNGAKFAAAYHAGFLQMSIGVTLKSLGARPRLRTTGSQTGLVQLTYAGGTLVTPVATEVRMLAFKNVYIIKDYQSDSPVWFQLTYGTHYSEASLDDGSWGIELIDNVEGSVSCATINPLSDILVVDMLGHNYDADYDGETLFPVDYLYTTGSATGSGHFHPLCVLYHVLKDRLGFSEAEINGESFIEAVGESQNEIVSASLPNTPSDGFEGYRTVIARLLSAALCRAYFDNEGRFSVKIIEPMGAADATIDESDIVGEPSFEYQFSETANPFYENGLQEYKLVKVKADVLGGATSGVASFKTVPMSTSDEFGAPEVAENTYLHQTDSVKTVETYYFGNQLFYELSQEDYPFSQYVRRLGFIVGSRRARLSLYVRSGAWSLNLGDVVSISRKKLPGYAYDGETEQTQSFVVTEIVKSLNGVALVLDDQLSIEEADEDGDWD